MIDYSAAININSKHRIPTTTNRKKTYRINSLARELRNLGKPFDWFTKNTIAFNLPCDMPALYKKRIFISGSLTCYKVRIDYWYWCEAGDFTYTEYISNDGRELLYNLVKLNVLDETYKP